MKLHILHSRLIAFPVFLKWNCIEILVLFNTSCTRPRIAVLTLVKWKRNKKENTRVEYL